MKLFSLGIACLLSGCFLQMLAAQNAISHGVYDPANDPNADAALENPVPADKNSLARGSALFQKHCVECHGRTGVGDGPKSKDTSPAVPNLRSIKDPSDTHLYRQIAFGRQDMPTWEKKLNEKNLWDLVNYVQSINTKKGKK